MRVCCLLLLVSSFLFAGPSEEVTEHYQALLQDTGNEVLMTSLVEAWLNEQSRVELEEWLEAEAESGETARQLIWAQYLALVDAHERALEEYQKVLKREPGNGGAELAIAELQATELKFAAALKTLGEREDRAAVILRGLCEYRLRNEEVAQALWDEVLAAEPTNRELRAELVNLFEEENLWKQACEAQEELITLLEEPSQRERARLKLGDLRLEADLRDAALASYREVLAASEENSWLEREALHKIREAFMQRGDEYGLSDFMVKLRKEMPQRLTLRKSLARQLTVSGQVEEGVEVFREILQQQQGDESLRLEFVELLAFSQRHEEAIAELEAVIAREATAERWLRLAELRSFSGGKEELAALREVEKLRGDSAVELLEMARIYARFEKNEEALRILKKGRVEHEESGEISRAFVEVLVSQGRESEALVVWQTMVKDGGVAEALWVAKSQRRLGLNAEAFITLGDYRQELGNDFVGLSLYCELAQELGEVEVAWKSVQRLVVLANDFSHLQMAVNLGLAIGNEYGSEEAVAELTQSEEVNVRCLLASLQQSAGRLLDADAALEGVDGELAQQHRIALLTQRGDILAALEEVKQWKDSSPNKVAAWKERAALLAKLERYRDAEKELQQARNLFEEDWSALTRELAKVQLSLGKYEEAWQLYEQLFRVAPTSEERARYLNEMYSMAQRIRSQDTLTARLEQEFAATREPSQLRLLAQLYKLSNDPGKRQRVLLEWYRLSPNDEEALFELVALAEENSDIVGARELLLAHLMRTRSPKVLPHLARLQIRVGEIEAGLAVLSRISANDLTASDVEAIAVQLWRRGEHQLVLEFLNRYKVVVDTDWRLQFLLADFLIRMDRAEEAKSIWIELLGVEHDLERTFVSERGRYWQVLEKMTDYGWWHLLQIDFSDERSRFSERVPREANEVRWLSLARLAQANLQSDSTGQSWQEFLKTLRYPWTVQVREWGLRQKMIPVPRVGERLQEAPSDKEPETSREELLKLAAEIEDENPVKANGYRIEAAFKLPEGEEQLEMLRELAESITKEEPTLVSNATRFIQLVGVRDVYALIPLLREDPPSTAQKKKLQLLEAWWENRIEDIIEKDSWGSGELLSAFAEDRVVAMPSLVTEGGAFLPLAIQRLSGDVSGMLENLDRLLEAHPPVQDPTHWDFYRDLESSASLQGLPNRHSVLSGLAFRHLIYGYISRSRSSPIISPELLEKARELGWEQKGDKSIQEFAKLIPQVEDDFLRVLLYEKLGLQKEFFTELEALSVQGTLFEKLDGLALRFASLQNEKNEQLLTELLAIERAELSAAQLNLLDTVTLGEAAKRRLPQGAAPRLREELVKMLARFEANPLNRSKLDSLSQVYRSLGMEAPPQRGYRASTRSRQREGYRKLFSAQTGSHTNRSETQRREADFLGQLERSFLSRDPLENLVSLANNEYYQGFKEEGIAFYQPGDSRSYLERMRYVWLCLAYGEKERAEKILIELKEERPYDIELEALWVLSRMPDELTAALDKVAEGDDLDHAIKLLITVADVTGDEESFFGAYERLVALVQNRADEFSCEHSQQILQAFQGLQKSPKELGGRSLRSMSSLLRKLKEGDDPKLGTWALRDRQRTVLIAAFVEMMRLRSVRDEVLQHITTNQNELRLSEKNVEWMVFEALKKTPVTEAKWEKAVSLRRQHHSHSGRLANVDHLALKALLRSEDFKAESVDLLVKHAFLNERQGALVKAVLEEDEDEMTSLLTTYLEEKERELPADFQRVGLLNWGADSLERIWEADSRQRWGRLVELLIRSEQGEASLRGILEDALASLLSEQQFKRAKLLRICELGTLEESVAALENVAAEHFLVETTPETYRKLRMADLVPREVQQKADEGFSLFGSLANTPRTWIPLLTFLEKSKLRNWVGENPERIRSQVRRRLDVMYKSVFYDRLRAEGFGGYDGLALLGREEFSNSGKATSWLEELMTPLKLSPTEGRTYWLVFSKDCQEQADKINYLMAFVAMRKDYEIDEAGRQEFLTKVLELEVEELSILNNEQLRGLANLVERDFPDLQIPQASPKLEDLLERLRDSGGEGIVERMASIMASGEEMASLYESKAKGLCTSLAAEGEVELAAEFWVRYLETRANSQQKVNFRNLNFYLLAREPFMGTLDLLDSIRFVRLVQEALVDTPHLADGMAYTRSSLLYVDEFDAYLGREKDIVGLVPFLDKTLQRDGVTESDRRVMGGFLIKMVLGRRYYKASDPAFRAQLSESNLQEHSPGILETILAVTQLRDEREAVADAKALAVLYDYLRDQDLVPDFRKSLARTLKAELERDKELLIHLEVEPIAVTLRDYLLRSSYGAAGDIGTTGPIMHFLNQYLDSLSSELQKELYEGWTAALEEDAGRVLTQKVGPSQRIRMFDILFEFMDGGKRFPLPQKLIETLPGSFAGELEVMQKLLRSGNEELAVSLVPEDSKSRFKLNKWEYSSTTDELAEEILPLLLPKDQLLLQCYLASLRDGAQWEDFKESRGHRQNDRARAAARIFVKNPPEKQEDRLWAIDCLEHSVDALKELMPLLTTDFENDLPEVTRRHQGQVEYMLRWVAAGGVEALSLLTPRENGFLQMNRVSYYSQELIELQELLFPLLNTAEKMNLLCEFARLRDPREEGEKKNDFLPRAERVKSAARYILSNPLLEEEREVEKKCIDRLIKADLPAAEVQALMQRHLKGGEEINATLLAKLSSVEIDLLAHQLRTDILAGEATSAITCLQLLADPESKIAERQRLKLLSRLLVKITLPVVVYAAEQEGREELLVELKTLGARFFTVAFTDRANIDQEGQRAILFLSFATHCLTGDKDGFESLRKTAVNDNERRVDGLIQRERDHFAYGGIGVPSFVLPVGQPFVFDREYYHSDEVKPLRKLLFDEIRKHSFMGLHPNVAEPSLGRLVSYLKLTLADVELEKTDLAEERGDISLVVEAILAGDHELFLALLPVEEENYFEGALGDKRSMENRYIFYRKVEFLGRRIQRHLRSGKDFEKVLDLVKNDTQRLHLEVCLQSLFSMYGVSCSRFNLLEIDAKMAEVILAVLPKSGPVRTQILAQLVNYVRKEPKLSEVLAREARSVGAELKVKSDEYEVMAQDESCNLFVFGWNYALQRDDWSVLDFHFESGVDESVVSTLRKMACVQALYQVAGDPSQRDHVLAKLARYGVKKADPEFHSWLEFISLVAGAERSLWKEDWEALPEERKKRSQQEMTAGLIEVLSFLGRKVAYQSDGIQRRGDLFHCLRRLWMEPKTRERYTRVLSTVMDDQLDLFSTAQIPAEERARLLIRVFGWSFMKSCIEERFEEKEKRELLIELALEGRVPSGTKYDFDAFVALQALRAEQSDPRRSQLWFKVAMARISRDNLEGAKRASEQIDPSHVGTIEMNRLRREFKLLEDNLSKKR